MDAVPLSTPDPGQLVDLDRAHVWHPYASAVDPLPVYPVVGAQGTRLELADGRELVDGMSSWWAAIHGYRHPVLDRAMHEQVDRFAHVMFGGLTHRPAVELADLLVRITPAPLTRVFFSDSGSVAVEVALKMALQYWQGRGEPTRQRVVTVRGGYHGDTAGAMSVCDPVTGMHGLFRDYLPRQLFADRPRPRYDEEVRDTDLDPVATLLRDHPGEVAAVIIEPIVQGAGGMRFYAPEYLRRLRALCDEYGTLLIADEIATGFGRTGRLWGSDHAGVVPDIFCVGKALTGGYLSMAATLCTDEVAEGICATPGGVFMHGPTFMGNPLAAAVAHASVELLLSADWSSRVAAVSAGLTEGLAAARELPQVAEVRVLGAIGVIELREPVDLRRMQAAIVDRGAWVRPFGRLVYAMPPYVSTAADLQVVTAAMVGAVAACG
ncbi:MAG TPA: adenosylmethionine--8-amino-7-oxononanoate transaminase [Mycobacteriales bacterium]|nr:adenosylmethionine-8-amino-7-oxononanoate aminotransferase [Cryptosporangiaceae bacterium]MDQ1675814.1 adenosylmethionine---8-amino-7-oxononanoate aminotransferase [Actinomycetota bacterium]HEV7754274.1 adenosylmethionine--8-amino-7-oxononanoate transaminase [Mycobacteriales bacterium]